jgi:hypothetical protein
VWVFHWKYLKKWYGTILYARVEWIYLRFLTPDTPHPMNIPGNMLQRCDPQGGFPFPIDPKHERRFDIQHHIVGIASFGLHQ